MVDSHGDAVASDHPVSGQTRMKKNIETVDGMTQLNNKYDLERLVGKGAYGNVSSAVNKSTGEVVALKQISLDSEALRSKNSRKLGFPLPCIREISLLKQLKGQHPNIITLVEVISSNSSFQKPLTASIYLVFEYMEFDLRGLVSAGIKLGEEEIKCLFGQIVDAVGFLHSKRICHRDIKSANILISKDFEVKMTDFGLARVMPRRSIRRKRALTNHIVTIWYKAPELLLGSMDYDFKIDIWPLGCMLFEMFTNSAIFSEETEPLMLKSILKLLGTPNLRVSPKIGANSELGPKLDDDNESVDSFLKQDEEVEEKYEDGDDENLKEPHDAFLVLEDFGLKETPSGLDEIKEVKDAGLQNEWRGIHHLPKWQSLKRDKLTKYKSELRPFLTKKIETASDSLLDLFERIFTLDPNRRISAKLLLDHDYLKDRKSAAELAKAGKELADGHESLHEMEGKKIKDRRRKEKAAAEGSSSIPRSLSNHMLSQESTHETSDYGKKDKSKSLPPKENKNRINEKSPNAEKPSHDPLEISEQDVLPRTNEAFTQINPTFGEALALHESEQSRGNRPSESSRGGYNGSAESFHGSQERGIYNDDHHDRDRAERRASNERFQSRSPSERFQRSSDNRSRDRARQRYPSRSPSRNWSDNRRGNRNRTEPRQRSGGFGNRDVDMNNQYLYSGRRSISPDFHDQRHYEADSYYGGDQHHRQQYDDRGDFMARGRFPRARGGRSRTPDRDGGRNHNGNHRGYKRRRSDNRSRR